MARAADPARGDQRLGVAHLRRQRVRRVHRGLLARPRRPPAVAAARRADAAAAAGDGAGQPGAARLKAIVLHANNAHDPYCVRYDPARAPYPARGLPQGVAPSAANIDAVRRDCANAVDASIGLLDAVIAALDRRPEPVFLVYTPDHGENLLDDGCASWGHALVHPTRRDTRVPAVFWPTRLARGACVAMGGAAVGGRRAPDARRPGVHAAGRRRRDLRRPAPAARRPGRRSAAGPLASAR